MGDPDWGKIMLRRSVQIGMLIFAIAVVVTRLAAAGAESQIERGKYLVTIGGCSDCHTPGTFLGRRLVDRTDRDGHHKGHASGWPRACAGHALRFFRTSHAFRCACHRRLLEELEAGEKCGPRSLRPERQADNLRLRRASGRCLQRAFAAVRIGAISAGRRLARIELADPTIQLGARLARSEHRIKLSSA